MISCASRNAQSCCSAVTKAVAVLGPRRSRLRSEIQSLSLRVSRGSSSFAAPSVRPSVAPFRSYLHQWHDHKVIHSTRRWLHRRRTCKPQGVGGRAPMQCRAMAAPLVDARNEEVRHDYGSQPLVAALHVNQGAQWLQEAVVMPC